MLAQLYIRQIYVCTIYILPLRTFKLCVLINDVTTNKEVSQSKGEMIDFQG